MLVHPSAIFIHMRDIDCWYRVLELELGASLEEVNQAYKDLALIWHPDRLPQDNSRLLEKAQAKLQEINQAREQLRAHLQTAPAQTKIDRSRTPSGCQTTAPKYSTTAARSSGRKTAPETVYQRSQPNRDSSYHNYTTAKKRPSSNPDLSGTDFSGADLGERDFSGRNLSNANLSNANLKDSFLHGTNLHGANLHGANLFRANLLQANLSNTNLRAANLIGADLSGADLSGADLTGAKIRVADRLMVRLMGTNLSGTIMPDGKIHE